MFICSPWAWLDSDVETPRSGTVITIDSKPDKAASPPSSWDMRVPSRGNARSNW